jgi:ATP-dependent RNA circularization protein (DNA/RNA ligase family)
VIGDFFKYPHVPHLMWLGAAPAREDKVLSQEEAKDLLRDTVVVEEKVDGANLGVWIDPSGQVRLQNRGGIVESFTGQFRRLRDWLALHESDIRSRLAPNLIVFGEWCALAHSVNYDQLPDWWLLFDVYDREARRFWSVQRRDDWAAQVGVCTVPLVGRGHYSVTALQALVETRKSSLRNGFMEGVVVRVEEDGWLTSRAKLVRGDFVQSIDVHWRNKLARSNRLAPNH